MNENWRSVLRKQNESKTDNLKAAHHCLQKRPAATGSSGENPESKQSFGSTRASLGKIN